MKFYELVSYNSIFPNTCIMFYLQQLNQDIWNPTCINIFYKENLHKFAYHLIPVTRCIAIVTIVFYLYKFSFVSQTGSGYYPVTMQRLLSLLNT